MGKEKSDKSLSIDKGSSGKMFPKGGAVPSPPGVSAKMTNGSSACNAPKGGPAGVMGKQRHASPALPGQTSPGGKSAPGSFGVSGGKGHMAGHTGASPAKPQ
jgi:hypothetical protein